MNRFIWIVFAECIFFTHHFNSSNIEPHWMWGGPYSFTLTLWKTKWFFSSKNSVYYSKFCYDFVICHNRISVDANGHSLSMSFFSFDLFIEKTEMNENKRICLIEISLKIIIFNVCSCGPHLITTNSRTKANILRI